MATDRSPELEDGVNQQDDGDALVSEFNAAQAAYDAIREDSLSQHGRPPDELKAFADDLADAQQRLDTAAQS